MNHPPVNTKHLPSCPSCSPPRTITVSLDIIPSTISLPLSPSQESPLLRLTLTNTTTEPITFKYRFSPLNLVYSIFQQYQDSENATPSPEPGSNEPEKVSRPWEIIEYLHSHAHPVPLGQVISIESMKKQRIRIITDHNLPVLRDSDDDDDHPGPSIGSEGDYVTIPSSSSPADAVGSTSVSAPMGPRTTTIEYELPTCILDSLQPDCEYLFTFRRFDYSPTSPSRPIQGMDQDCPAADGAERGGSDEYALVKEDEEINVEENGAPIKFQTPGITVALRTRRARREKRRWFSTAQRTDDVVTGQGETQEGEQEEMQRAKKSRWRWIAEAIAGKV
jgi:hypothetical protein